MKHIQFYLSILSVLMIATVQGQGIPALQNQKVISKYEITAGVGLLKSSTYYAINKNKIGFSFGGGVSHVFSKSFELKIRGLYELKGSKTESRALLTKGAETTDVTKLISTNLYYLTGSAMPTFHFLKSKKLLAGAGAFYSVMTKIRIFEDRTDNATGITTTINHSGGNTTGLTSQKDFGISGYAGYVFNLSKNRDLTIMIHYNKSLTDYDDAYNTWQRSNVILLSASLGFSR